MGDDRADHGGRDGRSGERVGHQTGRPHCGAVKAPLVAINVVSGDAQATEAGTAELEELVTAVGGTWQTVEGDDVAKAIFSAAIDQQITQIVVGTSRLTRWQSMTRGSVIQQILRMASENDIDLHVIARRDASTGASDADEAG